MPELNGDEALKQIRRSGIKVPAVMVTANALPSQREQYLRAGADDVVCKPWTFPKLRTAILDAMHRGDDESTSSRVTQASRESVRAAATAASHASAGSGALMRSPY